MSKVVLFQGDSITDAGRDREDFYSLGGGYPLYVDALYYSHNPKADVQFLNRGIGGNRVRDLRARWQEDCIDLKPDVLSIMIGVNDTWRRYDSDDPTTTEAFETDYRYILEETKRSLPNTQLILIEQYVLPTPEDRKAWREDLDPKLQVTRKLAKEFGAALLPLDGIMAAAGIASSPEMWAADGVHPTSRGHALIAEKWLEIANL